MRGCGTSAAYMRHRRQGDPPCAECRKAWRDRQRAYRIKRSENRDPAQ